jgi:hypothetical protein
MAIFDLAMGSSENSPSRPALLLHSGRDPGADLLKGAACVLMVVAHVHFANAPWLQYVTMAAVLFFATSGMNLAGIVERRSGQEHRLAANALFLIFAGFADNYVQGTMGMCDVFQSAGAAILAMLLLRAIWPRYWTWLFPVPFLIHFANQQLHWKLDSGGIWSFFLTPGLFPLAPWLSFYLLGAHLRKYAHQSQPWFIGGSALLILAVLSRFQAFQFDKFWMSPEYFLVGCAVAAFSFAVLRRWLTESTAVRLSEVRLWGANSLVFYLANNFVIRILEMVMPHGITLFVLSITITVTLLRPVLRLQGWIARQRPQAVLLAGAVASSATLAANAILWPQSFYLRTLASFGLTFSFLICQPAWKNIGRAVLKARELNRRPAGANEALLNVTG